MAERHLKPIEQRNLWEQIADRIRTSILSGELTPGTHLVTADLATRLGVSRGPVREALMALESSGIVVSTRRHGTIVGTPSTVDLEEVLSVREAIETFAAVQVCAMADRVAQVELRALAEQLRLTEVTWLEGDHAAAREHDFAFHQTLVDLAGNSRFSTIYREMVAQNLHHVKGIDPDGWPLVGWDNMVASHHAILDAVVAGDADAARDALSVHYRGARWRTAVAVPRSQDERGAGPTRAVAG
jgi:DNA-binding GntR family transcriptional regulator